MDSERLSAYRQFYRVMQRFLERELTADEFATEYMRLWHDVIHKIAVEPESIVQQTVGDLVDTAFTAVEQYRPTGSHVSRNRRGRTARGDRREIRGVHRVDAAKRSWAGHVKIFC